MVVIQYCSVLPITQKIPLDLKFVFIEVFFKISIPLEGWKCNAVCDFVTCIKMKVQCIFTLKLKTHTHTHPQKTKNKNKKQTNKNKQTKQKTPQSFPAYKNNVCKCSGCWKHGVSDVFYECFRRFGISWIFTICEKVILAGYLLEIVWPSLLILFERLVSLWQKVPCHLCVWK